MNRVRNSNRFFQSILCPVDFSTASRIALQHADAVARRTDGRLTVMYADDPMLAAAAAAGYDREVLTRQTTTALRRLLRRIGVSLDKPHSPDIVCAVGRPVREILNAARRSMSDLIVMGTRGRTGVGRMFFGSVTERVLRATTVPVLAVPPRVSARSLSSWSNKPILCAVELGSRAREDVRNAAEVARGFGAKLRLVHVVQPTSGPPWLRERLRAHDQSRLQAARQKLEQLGRSVRTILHAQVQCRVLFGDPAREIASAATKAGTGLIVLTLRKGHGLFGRRQGTITYQVLCNALVPVLALRQRVRSVRSR